MTIQHRPSFGSGAGFRRANSGFGKLGGFSRPAGQPQQLVPGIPGAGPGPYTTATRASFMAPVRGGTRTQPGARLTIAGKDAIRSTGPTPETRRFVTLKGVKGRSDRGGGPSFGR